MPLPQSSSGSTYGALAKVNYQGLPPADVSYAWDNTALAPAIVDIANLSLTAPRFMARITLGATTGAMVLNNWFAVWQNATSTSPVLSRTSTGIFTVSTPAVVSDQYSQSLGQPSSIGVNLIMPVGYSFEGATAGICNISCSGNVITLNVFNASGTASDMVGVVLNLSVR